MIPDEAPASARPGREPASGRGNADGRGFPWRGLLVALGLWFGGMAGAALVLPPTAVVVIAPQGSALEAVGAAGGQILTAGRGFATARSADPDFVRRLYRAGAWAVWPALPRTCGFGTAVTPPAAPRPVAT
ncbi:MAG: hypothetical protein JO048_03865 [Methylobacteriaceae bacterium]|nr:hypothetical protein [Methylobacteriaceae bacterium]